MMQSLVDITLSFSRCNVYLICIYICILSHMVPTSLVCSIPAWVCNCRWLHWSMMYGFIYIYIYILTWKKKSQSNNHTIIQPGVHDSLHTVVLRLCNYTICEQQNVKRLGSGGNAQWQSCHYELKDSQCDVVQISGLQKAGDDLVARMLYSRHFEWQHPPHPHHTSLLRVRRNPKLEALFSEAVGPQLWIADVVTCCVQFLCHDDFNIPETPLRID